MDLLSSQQPPTKEIDVDFLVFIERYAADLLRWDILTFFANHPDLDVSAATVARHIGRSVHSVRPELGDLVLLGVLTRNQPEDGQTRYQLTSSSSLRKMTLKLADLIGESNAR